MESHQPTRSSEAETYNMKNIVDHPRYELVLKLVLRDEKIESIYKRMEANNVLQHESDLIIKMARKKRMSLIRLHCCKKIYQGVAVLAVAFGVFSFCRYKMGAIHLAVLIMCIAGIVYGFWLLSDGVTGILYAANRRGEIADIINE